jgi:hypothetical protein
VAVAANFAWALDVVRVMIVICGPIVIASTCLIFFPPKRYLAWLRKRTS